MISTAVLPQEAEVIDRYVDLYNEALEEAWNAEFIPPLKDLTYSQIEIYSSYLGFGFKMNPFTGRIGFSRFFIIPSKLETEVYAMADGIVEEIGFMQAIIKSKEFEICYVGIRTSDIKPGDSIQKGMCIGRVSTSGLSTGPVLLLSLKYKDVYLNPGYFMF